MSYKLLKKPLYRLLRYPTEPPPWPPGTSTDGRRFRPAAGYLYQQLIVWGAGFFATLVVELVILSGITIDVMGIRLDVSELNWSYLPIEAAIVLTLLAAVGKYYMIRVEYDLLYYIVTDRNVRIRQGQMTVREATYTIANVQNLNIRQGPIERLFGISRLIIETAGGAGAGGEDSDKKYPGHRGILKGISNPRELRDHLQRLSTQYADSGLGDPDDIRQSLLPEDSSPAGFPSEAAAVLLDIRDELRGIRTALRP